MCGAPNSSGTGTCYERFAIHNFDAHPQRCWLTFNFEADFRDLFEISGIQRARRGEHDQCRTDDTTHRSAIRVWTVSSGAREIRLDPAPDRLSESSGALCPRRCKPGEQMRHRPDGALPDGERSAAATFSEPYRAARRAAQTRQPAWAARSPAPTRWPTACCTGRAPISPC